MLTRVPQYFGTTKKMVVAFGGLFSNIFCVTKNRDNVTEKIVAVPIAYANKEKFITRLQQDPGLNEDVQISLPRLSFEIVGTDYDSGRQLNKLNKQISVKNNQTVYSYSPVPYILAFNLYSFTRTQEDNLQILEQILPYFSPDMNLSIKIMQNPDVIQDCQLVLNSVNTDDQYDGGYEERRYIITTYSFTLKMSYFSPLLGLTDHENHFEGGASTRVIKRVITNLNNSKYTVEVDPFEANEDDPHSLVDSWSPREPGTDFDTNVTL
jgi:hypothetical protein